MATTKFTPPAVPFDASPSLRQWLDEQVRRLSVLVNDAAQVNEDETISGDWIFSGAVTLPQAAVTQHQAALTISESQITDGSILARLAADETVTGAWTFADLVTLGDGRITTDAGSNDLELVVGTSNYSVVNRGIGDDGTDTVVLPASGGLIFMTAATTSTSEVNGYAVFMAAGTAITELHTGSQFSIGTAGSNPDVDGASNVWIGTSGTLSIKNRRGTFRRYTIYIMATGA